MALSLLYNYEVIKYVFKSIINLVSLQRIQLLILSYATNDFFFLIRKTFVYKEYIWS